MSLANNIEFLRRLPKLNELKGLGSLPQALSRGAKSSRLTETIGFGSNPGDLKMFSYLPGDQRARQKLPLVVVLHGCTQNAAGYDSGAGWSTLAARYGFALLMPEQKPSNNGNACFNWFNPEDTARGGGEALSIRQMIARMASDHGVDDKRIFVTGLSAGGAMTAVMLATYPETFAGGAIIAGLPYGIASNVQQALNGMFQSPSRPARELGDLVRNASKHKGPWPRLFSVARQRRQDRQPRQCQRDRQAMARRASSAANADVAIDGRRLSSRAVVECRWRDAGRILHHHRHGPRHAARPRR